MDTMSMVDLNEEFIKRIYSFIKCPRCKRNLKCNRRKSMYNKNKHEGVCDHCINEYFFHKIITKSRIDKKTASRENPSKKYKEKVKLWLMKILDLLENNMILLEAAKFSKHTRPKLSTEILYRNYKISLTNVHEPKVDLMLRTGKDVLTLAKENPYQIKEQASRIRYYGDETKTGELNNETTSLLWTTDDELTYIDKRPTLLHSKLQMLKKEICNEDEKPVKKLYHDKSCHKKQYSDTPKRTTKGYLKKDKTESLYNLSDDLSSKNIRSTNSTFSNIQRAFSTPVEALNSSISDLTEKTFEANFSYFFPKEDQGKRAVRRHKNSSEILKEVMEMLSTRIELEKNKKEKDRKRKIEEEIKKEDYLGKITCKSEDRTEKLRQSEILQTIKESKKKADEKNGEINSIKSNSIKSQIKTKAFKLDKDNLKSQKNCELKKRQGDRSAMDKDRQLKDDSNKKELLGTENERTIRKNKGKSGKLHGKEEKEIFTKEKQESEQKKEKELHVPSVKQEKEEDEEKTNQNVDTRDLYAEILKAKRKEIKSKEKTYNETKLSENAIRIEKEKSKSCKTQEEPTVKELSISKVKLRKPSTDDLILRLVQIKPSDGEQLRLRPRCLSELNISPVVFKRHQGHKLNHCMHGTHCMICENSELELDIDNILYNEKKGEEDTDIIMGTRIVKNHFPYVENLKSKNDLEPIIFKTEFQPLEVDNEKEVELNPPILFKKQAEKEVAKGVMRYALSDRSFIDKGWTILPTEKVVRQMNVYRMRPAHPELDWFKHNKSKKLMLYETGEKLAEFDDNGKGRWFYRNGRKALDYYDAEEIHAQQRFVVYSNGETDERGRSWPITILATFDYLGNGIVFDHSGKIRLKYNQTEGVVLDRNIGPVSHWKWHTLNDPPVLRQIMIDTQLTHKDPDVLKFNDDNKPRNDNEEMLTIELNNYIKEKSKKLSQKFEPFQIKMKALKINENFSLKVLSQAKVYLIFRDGSTNLKLNMGMILDDKEIVDTDIAEVGEVSNSLERLPAPSTSLAGLQQSIAHAQRVERARLERERRGQLRPTQSFASADKLTANASKPLRQTFRTVPSEATTNITECRCRCRKPSTKNVYYDTRFI